MLFRYLQEIDDKKKKNDHKKISVYAKIYMN